MGKYLQGQGSVYSIDPSNAGNRLVQNDRGGVFACPADDIAMTSPTIGGSGLNGVGLSYILNAGVCGINAPSNASPISFGGTGVETAVYNAAGNVIIGWNCHE